MTCYSSHPGKIFTVLLEEEMSKKGKKDKKAKKKNSPNGTDKTGVVEVQAISEHHPVSPRIPVDGQVPIDKKKYEKELARLQVELVKLQEWFAKKLVVKCFGGNVRQ
jgi:polyphosphate kinase 2 (PPK2 family)